MRRLVALLLLLLSGVLVSGPLLAETPDRVAVRVGNHPGHGRIVLDWPRQVVFRSERDGAALRLFFTAPEEVDVAGARHPPRNVRSVAAIPGGVEVSLAPGVEPRVFRLGGRIVIDALNAATGEAAPALPARHLAPARPAPAAVPAVAEPAPVPLVTTAPLPPPSAAPAPPVAVPAVLAIEPPPAPRPPAAIALTRPAPGVFLLTTSPPPAVAVLRRGAEMLVLFDRAVPLDLAALRADPLLEQAGITPLPGAVLLRLPVAEGAGLRATRNGNDWRFELLPVATAPAPMRLDAAPGPPVRLALQAAQAGRVVALTDPLTGLPMLVGTMLGTGEGPGQGMPQGRRLPEAEMLPSLLGVAVLARAETVTLVALTDRFLLGAGPDGLRLGPAAGEGPPAAAAAMTRSFDIPGGTPASLSERLRAQSAGLAVAAPLTRGPLRLAAAETLMALGQPQEAQAMLTIALQEDPRAARDTRIIALQAAAALLSGRLAEAAPLATIALAASDEATLWRAVLAAAQGEAAAAAPGIAATLPLLAAYPEPLRLRLLPHAAEALVEGGAPAAAARLLQDAPDLPALRLVRARLDETQGHLAEALAGYDEVARGRDRLARAEALRRSVELRLQTGALDAAGAAAALDAALFAWRGDGREIATRERVAELQLQAGAPRAALALLQESATLFPERAEALHPAIATAFLAALEAEPVLAAAALFETERALLPDGPEGTRALGRLAGRLASMELGDRAAGLLTQAMARADAPGRAAFGLRLARLRLEDRDAAGALAALEGSRAPGLDPGLVLERSRTQARALAAHADLPAALELLRGLGLPGADLVAELLAEAQDWPGAAAAFGELVAALPAGPLEAEPQRLVLRAAAAALLAGDEARSSALAARFTERMAETPLALAFARLTGDPGTALAELPRLTRELDLFRNPPTRLEALRAGGPVAR